MIPLVRPSFPDMKRVLARWEKSTNKSRVYTNFGPLWQEAAERLEALTGRVAIPCSSGTEAVALAIASFEVVSQHIDFEAFTFQATRIAAFRVAETTGALTNPRATDHPGVASRVMVRTVPFGRYREFSGKDPRLVIDAAGAFGPGAWDDYPSNAVIACSFHATKNFPIGEGGAVFMPKNSPPGQKEALIAAMNFGINPITRELNRWSYCTNAKLDEFRCATLLEQLEPDRIDYFKARSFKIRTTTLLLGLPGYVTGDYQSLVALPFKDPVGVIARLATAGFVARRMYAPYVAEQMLTKPELSMVALPSDLTTEEFDLIRELLNKEQTYEK